LKPRSKLPGSVQRRTTGAQETALLHHLSTKKGPAVGQGPLYSPKQTANIAPENGWLEDGCLLFFALRPIFRGEKCLFQEGGYTESKFIFQRLVIFQGRFVSFTEKITSVGQRVMKYYLVAHGC